MLRIVWRLTLKKTEIINTKVKNIINPKFWSKVVIILELLRLNNETFIENCVRMILLNFDIKSLKNFIVNRKCAIYLDRIKAPLVPIFIKCQIGSSDFQSNRPQWKRSTKNYVVKVTSAFIPLLFFFYYNIQNDKCYM